ncbi:hypothetical protein [Nitrosospira sp. NpAV]|uniref:hypothetical protein n=1 Tax=Nitrosospira sp. NpAV TaxID=58133 RepID=UPI00059F8432|nr:hypothetical protein [Nitrosospira sp. NpAV]KIO48207.1 hypothetical protein SQ11_13715 [Nitrosospira sp. NpAV]
MIRRLASLLVFGLVCSGHSTHAAAQEVDTMVAPMGSIPGGMGHDMAQNSPFVSPGMLPSHPPNPHNNIPSNRLPGSTPGTPLVLLPVPASSMSGINTPYGYQFPGSYMPSGTSLHRYNGYVVCDPPDLNKGTATQTTGATGQRIVKITTTRSPTAPGHQQPCPVYTVNGEPQQPKGYTTTPSIRSAPNDK